MIENRTKSQIETPAGLNPSGRGRLTRLRHEIPAFIGKNKGLLSRGDAWQMVPRIIAMRRRRTVDPDAPLRFVSTHHKVMTSYFNAVLRLLGAALRLPYEQVNFQQPGSGARLVLSGQSRLDLSAFEFYRGVHLMRDPRDMIVSGYHYHKWTYEDWVHRPDESGQSYQAKLNRLDRDAGLFLEIDHFIFSYRDILEAWPLDDPDLIEVRFADLMGAARDAEYDRIFAHLGLGGAAHGLAVDLMRLFEAASRTGRDSGRVTQRAHVRSAASGQWKSTLTSAHLEYIDAELGPVIRKFGFAT